MHSEPGAGAKVTGFVYGTLFVLALLVSLDDQDPPRAVDVVYMLIGTVVPLALAHAHAEVTGLSYDRGGSVPWGTGLRHVLHSWPMLASGAVPVAIFLLAAAELTSLRFAFDASQILLCISLFVIGYSTRRRSGGSVARSVTDGAIDLALGILIVTLKLVAH